MTSLLYSPTFRSFGLTKPVFENSLPDVDIEESEGAITLTCDVPGVPPDGVELTVHDHILKMTATRATTTEHTRRRGTYTWSFRLGPNVDEGNVSAALKDGVLTVTVGKKPEAQPRKIAVT